VRALKTNELFVLSEYAVATNYGKIATLRPRNWKNLAPGISLGS
jgi:hypothetical protein